MSKQKRIFASAAESERNIQECLDSLNNQPFLGNEFIDDNSEVVQNSSSNQDEDKIINDDEDGRNPDTPANNSNDVYDSALRQHKFYFKNLDAVVDQKYYDPLLEQPYE